MSRRSLATCSVPGCPNLATKGKCDVHRREQWRKLDAARPSAAKRGYGKAWQKRRIRQLKRHPFCEVPGCPLPASQVHHDPPRAKLVALGVPDPDAEEYLHSLCENHHSQKTAREVWHTPGREPVDPYSPETGCLGISGSLRIGSRQKWGALSEQDASPAPESALSGLLALCRRGLRARP